MVVRRMSAREARANFSDLLGTVFYTNEPVIVERKGKPFAVVISPEQYRVMQKEIQRAWRSVDELRAENQSTPVEQAKKVQDVTAEVEAVREEAHGKRRGPESRR